MQSNAVQQPADSGDVARQREEHEGPTVACDKCLGFGTVKHRGTGSKKCVECGGTGQVQP